MNKNKLIYYLVVNLFINILFISKVRIFLYNILLGYNISYKASFGIFILIIAEKVKISDRAKIGHFALIFDCDSVTLKSNSKIYRYVRIMGLRTFSLGNNSIIGVSTNIISRHSDRNANKIINGGRFIAGNNVTITNKHLFDLCGNILIKEKVVIGGANSLFYTHGFDCYGNISYGDIILQRNIYVGANTIFLPGCIINSEIVVGAGAVISKSLKEKGVYGGNPVRKISDNPKAKCFVIKK